MARRYLTAYEADLALKRGKVIECFLGRCQRDGIPGFRRIAVYVDDEGIHLSLYETADEGNEHFLDVYVFGSLNPALEQVEADEELTFETISDFLELIESRYPGSSSRLVNEGVIQDEYADFIARGRK